MEGRMQGRCSIGGRRVPARAGAPWWGEEAEPLAGREGEALHTAGGMQGGGGCMGR